MDVVEEGVRSGRARIRLGGGGVEEREHGEGAFRVLAAGSDPAEHGVDVEAAMEGQGLRRGRVRVEGHEAGDVGGELAPAPGPRQVLQVADVEEHRRLPLQPGSARNAMIK